MSKELVKLSEREFMGAEFARQVFRIIPKAGVTMEQIANPEYFGNVARRINPHDLIEVVPEDGAYYALLIVTNTGKMSVKTQALSFVELSEKRTKIDLTTLGEMFDVNYAGPVAKWRVLRKSDNTVISPDPFVNRQEAEDWLEKNGRKLIAA